MLDGRLCALHSGDLRQGKAPFTGKIFLSSHAMYGIKCRLSGGPRQGSLESGGEVPFIASHREGQGLKVKLQDST